MRKLPLVVLALFAGGLTAALVFTLHNGVRAGVGLAPTDKNGDVNGDGQLDISDAVYTLVHLFKGGPEPVACADSPELLDRVASLEQRLAGLDEMAARVPGLETRLLSLEEQEDATARRTIVSAWNGSGRFTHDQQSTFWLQLQDPTCCDNYGSAMYLTGGAMSGRHLQFRTVAAGQLLIRLQVADSDVARRIAGFRASLDGDHDAAGIGWCTEGDPCFKPRAVSFAFVDVPPGDHVLGLGAYLFNVVPEQDIPAFEQNAALNTCALSVELQPGE